MTPSGTDFRALPSSLHFLQLRRERPTDDGIVGSSVDESGDVVAVEYYVEVAGSSSCVAVGSRRRITAASKCCSASMLRRPVLVGPRRFVSRASSASRRVLQVSSRCRRRRPRRIFGISSYSNRTSIGCCP
uniref:Uncharacterized protein n=1 Tax=Rhipicephalus zambeziensis TaxID=60191 RepID=A0A224YB99_9ACAR